MSGSHGFDTLTERAARTVAERALHHARSTGRPFVDDGAVAAARLGEQGPFVNVAVVLDEPSEWDDVVERIEQVIPRGSTATLISPFPTPDLARRGWVLIGHPPLMLRPVGATPAPPVPPELHIREVVDRDGLEEFEHALVDSYPMPALQPYEWGHFFDERVLGGGTRMWIGSVEGEPVATAAVHVAAGLNDVEMIATAPAARGKGYGAAVTWAATTADPTLPAVLIASDLGRPVYERLGYIALTRWTLWLRE